MRKKAKGILKPLPAPPRPFGNPFQLSKILGEEGDDLVGLTVVCGSDDNGVCFEERHEEIVPIVWIVQIVNIVNNVPFTWRT